MLWNHSYTSTVSQPAQIPNTQNMGLTFQRGYLRPEQVMDNAEMGVSLLQVAAQGIHRIQECLQAMEARLQSTAHLPEEDRVLDLGLNPFLQSQLAQIRFLTDHTTFKQRALLNGNLSLTGTGTRSRVLIASASHSLMSQAQIQVEVQQGATHSFLEGRDILTDDIIRSETQVSLHENGHRIKYRISPNETVHSLVTGLQALVQEVGMDLTVSLTNEGRLMIHHNQYGSLFVFSGLSEKTGILSQRPGHHQMCHLGHNCVALVDGLPVETRGYLLLCREDHPQWEGMAILWEGDTPGSDTITVSDQTIAVQGNELLQVTSLRLSVRSCTPSDLGRGITTRSGFCSLDEISVTTRQSLHDAWYLIRASQTELEQYLTELEALQNQFEQMALVALEASEFGHIDWTPDEAISGSVTVMSQMLHSNFLAVSE